MDWNRDGKHDWQDDAIYNNVINPEHGPEETASSGSRHKHTYNKGHQDFGPIYTDENRAAAENDEWVQSILKSREKFQKEQDELYEAHPEWVRKERPKDDFFGSDTHVDDNPLSLGTTIYVIVMLIGLIFTENKIICIVATVIWLWYIIRQEIHKNSQNKNDKNGL